jgi:hypothetical protein
VHLFTANAQKSRIYALVYLVDLTAGVKAIVISESKAIITLLAIKSRKRRGVALTVRAVGMRMEVALERNGRIEILVKRIYEQAAERVLLALDYDHMLLLTAKAIVKLQHSAVCYYRKRRSYGGVIVAHVIRVHRNDRYGVFHVLNKAKGSLKRRYSYARGLICGEYGRIG